VKTKLSKEEFLLGSKISDLDTKMDVEYAYQKYHNIENIKDYLRENQNVDIVLLDLERVGGKAFCSFLIPIMDYIKDQSQYWNQKFENFDNKDIDDSALSAFEILPSMIELRLNKFGSKLLCKKSLYEFVSWAIENMGNFNVDDIVDFEKIRGYYNRLANELRHLQE